MADGEWRMANGEPADGGWRISIGPA